MKKVGFCQVEQLYSTIYDLSIAKNCTLTKLAIDIISYVIGKIKYIVLKVYYQI